MGSRIESFPGPLSEVAWGAAKRVLRRLPLSRLRYRRFRGEFRTHAEAMQAVRAGALAGYDHAELVDITYRDMCEIKPWDYPVMFWLERALPGHGCVLDAGGHVGTKYRAFREHLRLDGRVNWVVYDVPATLRAGRELARAEALPSLSFVEKLADAPPADVLLASGLLQYLDIPLQELLRSLRSAPQHLLLNKVATREASTVVMLESFGTAEVPYQIRERREVELAIESLGYEIVDHWTIPSLSQAVTQQARCGAVTSRGYYARLNTTAATR